MNLTIKEAARLMHKSEQYVRLAIQQKILPIGIAVLNDGGRYSYYISPELFEKYTGIKLPEEYKTYTKKENTDTSNNDYSL